MKFHGAFLLIPAYVANHPEIDDATALFFGRLNALSNQEGYCFATDKYLAEISKCKYRVISDRLKKLKELDFIRIVTIKKGIKTERKIYTCNHYSSMETKGNKKMFTERTPVRPRSARPCVPPIYKEEKNNLEKNNPLPPLPPSPKKEEEEENLKRKEKLKQKSLKKGMDPKHFEKAYERLLECQDGHIGDEVEWMLEVARKFNIKQVNESKIKKRKEYAKKNLNYGTGTYSIASDEKGVHICSGNVKTSHAYADDKYWKEKGL